MRHSPHPAHVLLGLAIVLVSCTSPEEGPQVGQAKARPDDIVVELVGLDFKPVTLTVKLGQRVRWQWTDSVVHNVVSDDFASSKAQSGGAYAISFDRTGSFPYRCTLHTGMDGIIVVTP